jgi:hypothetical protein
MLSVLVLVLVLLMMMMVVGLPAPGSRSWGSTGRRTAQRALRSAFAPPRPSRYCHCCAADLSMPEARRGVGAWVINDQTADDVMKQLRRGAKHTGVFKTQRQMVIFLHGAAAMEPVVRAPPVLDATNAVGILNVQGCPMLSCPECTPLSPA